MSVHILPETRFTYRFICVALNFIYYNRTRTRTNTNPNDTKANAAGRRGVRVRSANGTFENQGAWGAKCLAMREALVGGVHSGNAHRKAPDLRNTKFHYSRGQKRLFSAQGA